MVAAIVTFLMRQDYIGKLPMITRNPLPAVLVAFSILWPLQLAYLILDTGPKGLAQPDLLATVWSGGAPSLFSNLFFAGIVGELTRRIAPYRWLTVLLAEYLLTQQILIGVCYLHYYQ